MHPMMMRRGRGRGNPDLDPMYSVEEDIIHTPVPPFDFYHLKPGAKARRALTKARKAGIKGSLLAYAPSWLLPFRSADVPHVQRLLVDVFTLDPILWVKYLCVKIALSLLPAISLYYSGQLFGIMQTAVDKREIDHTNVIRAFAGVAISKLLSRLSGWAKYETQLNVQVERYFGERIVRAKAFLDLPTSMDVPTLAKLSQFRAGGRTPWQLIDTLVSFGVLLIQLLSQVLVLLHLLREQSDSVWLVIGSFADPLVRYLKDNHTPSYAAVHNVDRSRRQTLDTLIEPNSGRLGYRKEIVANDLAEYFIQNYRLTRPDADRQTSDMVWNRYSNTTYQNMVLQLIQDAAAEGPRVLFVLRALNTPAHIPLSLATLEFVQSQVRTFTGLLRSFVRNAGSLQAQVLSIKDLYNLDKLPNLVKDGYKPLEAKGQGVSVEFESVTFKYPGQDTPAVQDVSFKLKGGDLCVIVGGNGQGKSSILKLLTRLYDATEGTVRIEDEPIQNYELSDLRRATSVLFQDFSTFPVSIEENIRMGDASTALLDLDAEQERRIHLAAERGGASEFISKLQNGYATNFRGDAKSWEPHGPEGSHILNAVFREWEKGNRNKDTNLSGGQSQRLALARTFMKPSEDVSLLIYDEPSASLDPQAEYDLFERLKALRGSKTMIFSTHRFGYLTKHADVILYMKDSTVVEIGTHDELIAQGGGYAHLYNLQASAFI